MLGKNWVLILQSSWSKQFKWQYSFHIWFRNSRRRKCYINYLFDDVIQSAVSGEELHWHKMSLPVTFDSATRYGLIDLRSRSFNSSSWSNFINNKVAKVVKSAAAALGGTTISAAAGLDLVVWYHLQHQQPRWMLELGQTAESKFVWK
jgi:hypothetical protein